MPFSPFPIRHDGRLGDWRSCWSGVRRRLTLWCHRVPAQDKASRREVVHAGTSGALVPQLREINLVRRMGAADRRELSEAVTSGEIGQSGVGAEGCAGREGVELGRCHTRGFILERGDDPGKQSACGQGAKRCFRNSVKSVSFKRLN